MNKIGVGDWVCTPRERELVTEVLDSGRLSYGPKSRELERKFADIHGSKYAVLSNSGTSSLHVAVQALKELHGWKDGDMIAIPSVTFVATANVLLHNNLLPLFVDVDPYTYNMDFRALQLMMHRHDNIRAIIPVHLFGQSAPMKEIGVWRDRGYYIIEDSCECMFATHFGKPVGSMGDIGCFSFYVAHLLTTGVGGIATTSNPDYAAKMRSLVNHGRDGIYISIDDADNKSAEELREIISKRFRFESVGHSFRITELEAALGLGQLETYEEMIRTRRRNAMELTTMLKDLAVDEIALPSTAHGNTHSWMMYPIVLLNEDKDGLVNHLEERGIETREMLPLINQPVYGGLDYDTLDYPVADWINRSGFYVGCHQYLTADDIGRIAEAIHDYFR